MAAEAGCGEPADAYGTVRAFPAPPSGAAASARVLRQQRPSAAAALFGRAAQVHLPAGYAVARGFCSARECAALDAWFGEGGAGAAAGVERTAFDGEALGEGEARDGEQPAVAQLYSRPAPLREHLPWLLQRVTALKDSFGEAIGVDRAELELVSHAQDVRHITYSAGHECPWHLDNPTSSFNTIVLLAEPGEEFTGGVLMMGPNDEAVPLSSLRRGDAVIYSTPRTEHAVTRVDSGERRICLVELKRRDLVEQEAVDAEAIGVEGSSEGATGEQPVSVLERCQREEEERKRRRPPQVAAAQALALLRERWGLQEPRVVRELVSYDDRNYEVVDDASGARFVLKLHNGVESDKPPFLEAMNMMMAAIDAAGVPCPTPLPLTGSGSGGLTALGVELGGGGDASSSHAARLLRWVPGAPLVTDKAQTESEWEGCGEMVGRMAAALAELDPPPEALTRMHLWDLANFPSVGAYVSCIKDESRQALARAVLSDFDSEVASLAASLPRQALHNDANEQNLLVADGQAAGVVDFGDAVLSFRVAEAAIMLAYQALDKADRVEACAAMLRGYARAAPRLNEDELRVLPALVRARLCCSVVMGAYSHSQDPENDYLLVTQEPGWAALRELSLMEADGGKREAFTRRMIEAYADGCGGQ